MGQSHSKNASRSYSYQRHHQTSLPSTHTSNYVDHNEQPVNYHPVAQNARVQRSTYGHSQDPHRPAVVAGNPATLPSPPVAQQSSVSPQHPLQHNAIDEPYPSPPNPVMQTQGTNAQYSNPANSPSLPLGHGSPSPPSSSSSSAHVCSMCGTTIIHGNDRKRRYKRHFKSQTDSLQWH